MTHIDDLKCYLADTGESMRSLSLRAGLGAKAVSDILSGSSKRPTFQTLSRLSQVIGQKLEVSETNDPQTYAELFVALEGKAKSGDARAPRLVRRLKWLLRETGWVKQTKPVCRREVIEFFEGSTAATFDLSVGSFSTYKSEVLAAIGEVETPMRPRGINDIEGLYYDLHGQIRDSNYPLDLKNACGSFLVFLHDSDIQPQEISTDVMARYYEYRLAVSPKGKRQCCKHVKRMTALLGKLNADVQFQSLGFPSVAHPFGDQRDKFGVDDGIVAPLLKEFDEKVTPWVTGKVSRDGLSREAFVRELDEEDAKGIAQADLKKAKLAMFTRQVTGNRKSDTKKRKAKFTNRGFLVGNQIWSQRTLGVRRGYIVACSKALFANSGFQITNIDELTDPEVVEAIAISLEGAQDADEFGSEYVPGILKALVKIARDFVVRDAEAVEEIANLIDAYQTGRTGIAPRNKAKLQEFTTKRIDRFLSVSDAVVRDLNHEVDRKRIAVKKETGRLPARKDVFDDQMVRDVMVAVAHDIMLARAPRSENLLAIELSWIGWRQDKARIVVPSALVKHRDNSDLDLVIPLGERQSRLLRLYIDELREKALMPGDEKNPYLFPRQPGGVFVPNHYNANLLKRLCKRVHEVVGVKINPHLYRHLIGWMWLRDDTSRLPDVQKILGHKSLETTLDYYAEIDEEISLQHWNDFLNAKDEKKDKKKNGTN